MADLKAFAEQLVNLTVKEVSELADILKEEYYNEKELFRAPSGGDQMIKKTKTK